MKTFIVKRGWVSWLFYYAINIMRCVAWKHFTRGKRKAQALSCCLEREGDSVAGVRERAARRGKRARMSERERTRNQSERGDRR